MSDYTVSVGATRSKRRQLTSYLNVSEPSAASAGAMQATAARSRLLSLMFVQAR
jgi:hypothetical protein